VARLAPMIFFQNFLARLFNGGDVFRAQPRCANFSENAHNRLAERLESGGDVR
jgi:hypothetical protein